MKGKFSVALSFLMLIALGAVALALPVCRVSGQWGDVMTSVFTACSAVCVTGLTVVDIAGTFTFTGQIVLLTLVEVGCLGLMMCGTFLMIAIGHIPEKVKVACSRRFDFSEYTHFDCSIHL